MEDPITVPHSEGAKKPSIRVFVTGASGYIGSAVVNALIDDGHEVLGLARSDESAAKLTALGAEVHRGSLDDIESIKAGAQQSDGVIHLAFDHSFTDMAAAAAADLKVIQTIGAALQGTHKTFIGTSGTMMVASLTGDIATESDVGQEGRPRVASENAVIALADKGVRSAVIRLAPSVHGDTDMHGFIPTLIRIAREKGVSAYVGEGTNRWPAVHLSDAVELYKIAVVSTTPGIRLHAVGDEGIPFRTIAETIGKKLNLPVASITPDEASAHFGFLGMFVQIDDASSSAYTQDFFGWKPEQVGLIADLEEGHYFDS